MTKVMKLTPLLVASLILVGCARPDTSPVASSDAVESLGGRVYGDMIMHLDQVDRVKDDASDLSSKKAGANFGGTSATYWANGIIPIVFSTGLTSSEKALIMKACAQWSMWGNVKCVERTTQTNYLQIKLGKGCWAHYGSSPNYVSEMILERPSCFTLGTIMHEFGHSLGMIHEHQRPDRDAFVRIDAGSIPSQWSDAFAKIPNPVRVGPYDFRSIMHYSKYLNGKIVMTTLPGGENDDVIGMSEALSLQDRRFPYEAYGPKRYALASTPPAGQVWVRDFYRPDTGTWYQNTDGSKTPVLYLPKKATFRVFASSATGTRTLKLCRRTSNGAYYSSTSCGTNTSVKTLGYIAAKATSTATKPLYRCQDGSSSRFYTTKSLTYCRDNGYVTQTIIGYVP